MGEAQHKSLECFPKIFSPVLLSGGSCRRRGIAGRPIRNESLLQATLAGRVEGPKKLK
jgi:hypothetical protein